MQRFRFEVASIVPAKVGTQRDEKLFRGLELLLDSRFRGNDGGNGPLEVTASGGTTEFENAKSSEP